MSAVEDLTADLRAAREENQRLRAQLGAVRDECRTQPLLCFANKVPEVGAAS